MFLCFWSNLKLLCNWTYFLVTCCFILLLWYWWIHLNPFESCLDLFNHSKWWCNFEFSIWFSFRKTSKLVNPLVKTCWSISRDDAILKFLFGSLKWLSKDGAIPFESYSVLFDGAILKFSIWHSCKRWCNINSLNMFKLVLTFRKKVQFRNFYLVHLHKMVQYKISLSWFILIYLNLSLSWSIPIYIYLDLSKSILIYPDIS